MPLSALTEAENIAAAISADANALRTQENITAVSNIGTETGNTEQVHTGNLPDTAGLAELAANGTEGTPQQFTWTEDGLLAISNESMLLPNAMSIEAFAQQQIDLQHNEVPEATGTPAVETSIGEGPVGNNAVNTADAMEGNAMGGNAATGNPTATGNRAEPTLRSSSHSAQENGSNTVPDAAEQAVLGEEISDLQGAITASDENLASSDSMTSTDTGSDSDEDEDEKKKKK